MFHLASTTPMIRCHTRLLECGEEGGEHGDGSRTGREHLDGVLEIGAGLYLIDIV